jgi:hypothetical protein
MTGLPLKTKQKIETQNKKKHTILYDETNKSDTKVK